MSEQDEYTEHLHRLHYNILQLIAWYIQLARNHAVTEKATKIQLKKIKLKLF